MAASRPGSPHRQITNSGWSGMADSQLRVAIIGAGIGGLSLGLALREHGIQADVFEQAPELTEIGAAIALSANATASTRGWACSTSSRPPPPIPPS